MKKFSRSFQIFLDFHNISRQRELFLDRGKSFLNRQTYFWTIENISRKTELFLGQQNYTRPLLSSMAFHIIGRFYCILHGFSNKNLCLPSISITQIHF